MDGWTIPRKTYYVAAPRRKDQLIVRCVIPGIIVPFMTLVSVLMSAALLQTYAPPMNTLWVNLLVASATALTIGSLWRRYHKYRAKLLESGDVVHVKLTAVTENMGGCRTWQYVSDDIRWRYLMGMARTNERNFLIETPRGNKALNEFLRSTPVESNWHPEIDQDLIFEKAADVLLHVRQTVGTT